MTGAETEQKRPEQNRTEQHGVAQDDFNRAVLLAEALIFASAEPVKPAALSALWQDQELGAMEAHLTEVLEALARHYEGHAVMLQPVAGGWQFRTRPEMVDALCHVVERPRKLPRAAMECLAVIAYHQPCTKAEIESVRGVALGQGVFDTLLEEGLVAPKGRREVPGRPVLWGTTPDFLRLFGLNVLSDLPRREELVQEDVLPDYKKAGNIVEEKTCPRNIRNDGTDGQGTGRQENGRGKGH